MKIKVRVDEAGSAYVGVIDPRSGDHKKSVAVKKGQEVVLGLPGVHDENGVEIYDVVDCDAEKPAETPQDAAPADGGGEGDQSDPAPAEGQGELPKGLGIGRMVVYRSKTGNYDLPAVVNCTVETLDPTGVELGHVPALDGPASVHLTVFTCGKQGTAREGAEVNNEAAGGSYQEFNIPQEILGDGDGDSEPSPGCWRWPERK